jgi:hypothetical protein
MVRFEIIRKGSAVEVRGLGVFRDKKDGRIRVTCPTSATYCPKGSSIERFFAEILDSN